MRWPLIAVVLAAACSQEANHLGNPLTLPLSGISTIVGNAAYEKRRGEVELIVKSNYPQIKNDIQAGGGPVLTEAFDIAAVPAQVRAPHTLQLQSDLALYETNLDALVVAIMVVSG